MVSNKLLNTNRMAGTKN